MHVIGGGDVVPSLKPFLKQDRLVMRGFVKDLDKELRSSDVFLFLNNAGPHLANFTRHVIAWSMGLCLVAHANSRKTLPEMTHMENALIGNTPEEIARMVYLAATDKDVNLRIRRQGRLTFERHFAPRPFVNRIAGIMEDTLKIKGGRTTA